MGTTSQSILCVQMYCNGHTQYTVYNKAVHYYFRKVRPYNRKMTSKVLKLFCDMKSHPARAGLLLLKTTGIPHEEVRLDLFRKVPVLTHGSLTIAESTSILRYVGQLPGGETWYWDRDLLDRIKVDEFLDYWQSTLNPAALKYAQNKLGYKFFFRQKEPNEELIKEALKHHSELNNSVKKHFLSGKTFIGGNRISIADLLFACTLQQTAAAGAEHEDFKEYIELVRQETLPHYDELGEDSRNIPDYLKKLKML